MSIFVQDERYGQERRRRLVCKKYEDGESPGVEGEIRWGGGTKGSYRSEGRGRQRWRGRRGG